MPINGDSSVRFRVGGGVSLAPLYSDSSIPMLRAQGELVGGRSAVGGMRVEGLGTLAIDVIAFPLMPGVGWFNYGVELGAQVELSTDAPNAFGVSLGAAARVGGGTSFGRESRSLTVINVSLAPVVGMFVRIREDHQLSLDFYPARVELSRFERVDDDGGWDDDANELAVGARLSNTCALSYSYMF